MPKGKANRIKFQEAPMGLGKMETKQSTGMPKGGGNSGKAVPGGAPDGKATPDGAGSMSMQHPDAGNDPKRMNIGSTVPGSRHAKNPL